MLDLKTKALPNTVTVAGKAFLINTDFRVWLQFEKDVTTKKQFDAKYIFKDEYPEFVPIPELIKFARPPRLLPRAIGPGTDEIALDFEIDSDLIYAAFLETYNIDLLQADLHWHVFLALLNGISEETKLAKVMSYRLYQKPRPKHDPYEELKRAWRIEPPETDEQKQEREAFDALFI